MNSQPVELYNVKEPFDLQEETISDWVEGTKGREDSDLEDNGSIGVS